MDTVTAADIQRFFTTAQGNGGSPENEVMDSVFDLEYIPTSKAADFNLLTSGYFTIADLGAPDLPAKAGSDNVDIDGRFWQIIVTGMNESHEETYSLHNTVADNIAVFATGAKPIGIGIRGYILVSGTDDYNYVFLRNYVEHFRARHLSASGKVLNFHSKDTSFSLLIESIALGHGIDFETYVAITVSGLAYAYGQVDSREPLYQGYDGTKRRAPVSMREEQREQEAEAAEKEAAKEEQDFVPPHLRQTPEVAESENAPPFARARED